MAKKILIVLAVLGVLLGVAAMVVSMQPDTFSVQRSVTVAAPPAAVFNQVNDFQAWDGWSPWKELDPDAKKTVSTPSTGKGATFNWSGNDKVGEGSLTILESRPGELVDIEQVFVRPLAGKARMVFTFAPEGGGTKVTWTMDGTNNFIGKAMCMVVDMDAMLGKDFDRGLASMKSVAEKGGAAQPAAAP
jgi:polyketide cyclase/dehydrase/lipid transport protein